MDNRKTVMDKMGILDILRVLLDKEARILKQDTPTIAQRLRLHTPRMLWVRICYPPPIRKISTPKAILGPAGHRSIIITSRTAILMTPFDFSILIPGILIHRWYLEHS